MVLLTLHNARSVTVGVLLFSSQQVSETIGHFPMTADAIMEELEVFVKKSEEQAAGITTAAAEEAIKNVNQDLDGRFDSYFS